LGKAPRYSCLQNRGFHSLCRNKNVTLPRSHWIQKRWHPVVSFNLADIGEGISQVDILAWSVKVGDTVEQFTPLCEVQSDKATVPITSRYAGKIVKIHTKEGEIALVGNALCDIDVPDESFTAQNDSHAPTATKAPEPVPPTKTVAHEDHSPVVNTITTSTGNHRVLATPAVRFHAKKNNIQISNVAGTGKDGRVTKADLLQYQQGGQKPQVTAATQSHQPVTPAKNKSSADQVITLRGVPRVMAQTMNESLTIPHLGLSDEIDMTNLFNLREQIKKPIQAKGVSLSFLPFIIKASSMAIEQYPLINSKINKQLTEVTLIGSHNIGVAVATPSGLIVPNIKNVQNLTVIQIAKELKRLIDLAQANKLPASDLADTTFSLSNIGAFGGTYAHPVLVAPQVVIGAIGKIQKLPRFDNNNQVVAQHIMNVSWSADHRVIDGATIAKFSLLWKDYLENPGTILLEDLM